MKLKKWKLIIFSLATALSMQIIPVQAAENAPIDYRKINEIFVGVLAPLVANDPLVSAVSIAVDPEYTDLENDKLRLNLATTLRETSWSRNPTSLTLTLTGTASVHVEADPAYVDLGLGFKLDVATETMPMFRYAAGVVKGMVECERVNRLTEAEKAYVCDQLDKLAQVLDLTGLTGFFVDFQEGVLALVDRELMDLRKQIEEATDPVVRTSLEKRYANTLATREYIAAFVLVPTIKGDAVTAIALRATRTLQLESLSVRSFTVNITNTNVVLGLDVNGKGWVTVEGYRSFKEEVINSLRRLEAGDPVELNRAKELGEFYISLVKGYTNQ